MLILTRHHDDCLLTCKHNQTQSVPVCLQTQPNTITACLPVNTITACLHANTTKHNHCLLASKHNQTQSLPAYLQLTTIIVQFSHCRLTCEHNQTQLLPKSVTVDLLANTTKHNYCPIQSLSTYLRTQPNTIIVQFSHCRLTSEHNQTQLLSNSVTVDLLANTTKHNYCPIQSLSTYLRTQPNTIIAQFSHC